MAREALRALAVVGLPPDQEITQIVEDLYEMEASSSSSAGAAAEASVHSPPWPAYPAQVIYRFPPAQGPELSDEELSSLCFPHKVSPTRLKRTPSWSNLQQVIFERQGDREQHGFVFMLKAGEGLPLFGVCIHTQEVLHRPPFIAAHNYPACKGPFRQCMISAPRCYCLLSRYPFFPLLFRVLVGVLAVERLHRTVMFNKETAKLSDLTSLAQNLNVDDPPLAKNTSDPNFKRRSTLNSRGGGGGGRGGDSTNGSRANETLLQPPERSRSISPGALHYRDANSHVELGYFSEGAKEGLMTAEPTTSTARVSSTSTRRFMRKSVSIIQRMRNDAQIQPVENEEESSKVGTTDPALFLSDGGGLMTKQPSRRGAIQRISERTLHVLSLNRSSSLVKQRKAGGGGDTTRITPVDLPTLERQPHADPPLGPPSSSCQTEVRGSKGKSVTLGGWIGGSSQSSSRPPLPPSFSSSLSSMNRSFQASSGSSSTLAPAPTPAVLGLLTPVKEPPASTSDAEGEARDEQDMMEEDASDVVRVHHKKKLILDPDPETRHPEASSPVLETDSSNPYPSVSFSPPFPILEASDTPKVPSFKPSLSSILSEHFASAVEGDLTQNDTAMEEHVCHHELAAQLLTAGMESSPTPPPLTPLKAEAEGTINQQGDNEHPLKLQERHSHASSYRSSYGGTGLLSPEAILSQIYYETPVPLPGQRLEVELAGGVGQISYLREIPRREGGEDEGSSSESLSHFSFPSLPSEIRTYAQSELSLCLQGWAVAATVRSLSLPNILAMVNAALLEQRIVAFSPVLSICSAVVLSLVPMIRPFKWQSLMLPVTPQNMTAFLDAPVPYILGIHFKTQDVQKQTVDIVRVNIYKDSVKNTGSLPQIPSLRALKAALQPHYNALRSTSGSQSRGSLYILSDDEAKAADSFCRVLGSHLANELVGDIRPHVITNVNQGKRTGVLMKTSVEECTSSSNRAFVTAFMETQMFSVWSDEVIRDKIERG